jgi:hypothetical protein
MYLTELTFSLGNTIPLQPITGDPGDAYSNVKPHISAKVVFGPTECDPDTPAGQALLDNAYENISGIVFRKMLQFRKEFKEFAKPE